MAEYLVSIQEEVHKVFTYKVQASSIVDAKDAANEKHFDTADQTEYYDEETVDSYIVDVAEVEK